ncbi:MAG: PIN domain-containing protein [Verrucomicrobia bacterium]|nr:MAG: PIN domain-containing protein [Verrucomicrobiota bacterium]
MDLPILVDSSVYIRLMRQRLDPVTVLFEHYDTVNLVTCGMVQLEVFRGMREAKARKRLEGFLSVMQYVPSDDRLWQQATDLAWQMDRLGAPMQATDALIAAAALRKGASVLTRDSDFHRVPGLHVVGLPPHLDPPSY